MKVETRLWRGTFCDWDTRCEWELYINLDTNATTPQIFRGGTMDEPSANADYSG